MKSSLVFLLLFLQFNTHAQVSCNNWLSVPSLPSYVTVGDVDVTGNQLTVEAHINRVAPYNTASYFGGHVISKHTGPTNINYALAITGCEIGTTNGYKSTPNVCAESLYKTYHLAMVYDGVTLKFYRNGFLMSSVAWTGNLLNNNFLTTIGQVSGNGYPASDQFYGFINEVRIWNVARTQSQIRAYMNGSLPTPAAQTGLLAYYTFDNLLNKQGNASFNGTLAGSASINATNSQCTNTVDSCGIPASPDFTPAIDIASLGFNEGNSRDFLLNVSNISTYSPNSGNVELRITKVSAFNITWNNTSGISNVFTPTPNNNSDWVITESPFFITAILKPSVQINPSSFSSIGFNISRKQGVAVNTSQNLTATIVNNSGGDYLPYNNTVNTLVTAL